MKSRGSRFGFDQLPYVLKYQSRCLAIFLVLTEVQGHANIPGYPGAFFSPSIVQFLNKCKLGLLTEH